MKFSITFFSNTFKFLEFMLFSILSESKIQIVQFNFNFNNKQTNNKLFIIIDLVLNIYDAFDQIIYSIYWKLFLSSIFYQNPKHKVIKNQKIIMRYSYFIVVA